jgi:hypothetical protein
MFELVDGFFVDPWCVMAIKSAGKGKCSVFLKGQSAMDGGFLIEKDALEAATDVVQARRDDDEEETDETPEETEEEEDEEEK